MISIDNVTAAVSARIRDKAGNCKMPDAARCCMSVASASQFCEDAGARLIGIASAFLLASEESGIRVPDLMAYAKNCMNTAEGRRAEFKAAGDYIREEIING